MMMIRIIKRLRLEPEAWPSLMWQVRPAGWACRSWGGGTETCIPDGTWSSGFHGVTAGVGRTM